MRPRAGGSASAGVPASGPSTGTTPCPARLPTASVGERQRCRARSVRLPSSALALRRCRWQRCGLMRRLSVCGMAQVCASRVAGALPTIGPLSDLDWCSVGAPSRQASALSCFSPPFCPPASPPTVAGRRIPTGSKVMFERVMLHGVEFEAPRPCALKHRRPSWAPAVVPPFHCEMSVLRKPAQCRGRREGLRGQRRREGETGAAKGREQREAG